MLTATELQLLLQTYSDRVTVPDTELYLQIIYFYRVRCNVTELQIQLQRLSYIFTVNFTEIQLQL